MKIYKMVNQTQQTMQEMQQHRQHVIGLASRETENITNSRKHHHVVLNKEQTTAANKLFGMLRTTDGRNNHLPINYVTPLAKEPKIPRKLQSLQPSGRESGEEGRQKLSGFHPAHRRSEPQEAESLQTA
jgi:hypothetical protein